ncbi:PRC-barrel domain-containing protein [Rhizobium herbae]|uniref:Sporulation protein YlmC with PRC-barrel domain n=1 Tax=Rhizobium herbae TaxID=508661 RepID=A0ABS4EVI3_9HYPH|nr:PRC-barrel domain-containing protein [Rhizobium herbae]MBP1861959.1 sporulation protein YlmC with PRC-barrel domain [Rhizobium herbae]
MIRTLLATTALAAFLASGALTSSAWAQDAATKADPAKPASTSSDASRQGPAGYFSAAPEQILATSVLGKTVYTGVDEQGEAIGDVNDVVINADGGAEALVIGVGGFLGIGEKDVAVNFDRVSWSDRDGQRIIVISATKEELQAAPEFKRTAIMDGVAAKMPEDDNASTPSAAPVITDEAAEATSPATGTTPEMTDPDLKPPVDTGTTAATPSDEMKLVDPALISADKLIGTDVKVADDTKVGEIGDVILSKDGKVEAYVIDVGGFLGIGQKPVAMSAESVQVMADAGGAMTIYSPFTKAQLESQAAYDEEAYKVNPRGIILEAPAN